MPSTGVDTSTVSMLQLALPFGRKRFPITPEIGDSGFGGPIRTTSRTSPIIKGDTIYIGDNQFTAVLLWRTIVSHHAFGAVTSTAVTLNVASDEHCNLWQTFRPRATSKIRFGFFTYCDRTIFDHNCPLKKLGLREFGCPISYWPVILL